MPRTTHAPFLRPDAGVLAPRPWTVHLANRAVPIDDPVEGWDYATPITLSRGAAIDLDRVLAACGLAPGAGLRWVLSWQSSWTSMRGWSEAVPVAGDAALAEVVIPGHLAGGTLRVESLLLLEGGAGLDPLAPRRPGSVLWRDSATVVLEATSARFPAQSLSFAAAGLPPGAAWVLQLAPHRLDDHVLGTVQLLLNTDHPAFGRLRGPAAPDRGTLSMLHFDVHRQLLCRALDDIDFDSEAEWLPDTTGATLSALLHRTFPGDTAESLRSLRALNPEDFEARIQAASRLLEV